MATTKRRRPKGTGSVRQRGSNYSVIWVDADGHRREKTIGPSKEAAQTALKQLVADASAGRRSRQTGYPFGLFVRTWLGQHTASASTIETSYRPIVENHLLPAFEDDDLQQMDVRLVNEYVRAKLSGDTVPPVRGLARQKLAPNSVRNHLSLLHAIFESARDQGIVTGANPVTKANKPKSRTEEVVPLSKRESEALVAEVPEAYRMRTQLLINLLLRIG